VTAPATLRRVTPTGLLVLTADQCGDREQWLAARRTGIGSSDVAAILGVADRNTAAHVYHDKLGHTSDRDSEPALWGRLLEDPVAQEWCRRNRSVISRTGLIRHDGTPWMLATLDRRVHECPLDGCRNVCALEVKTRSAFKAHKWHRDVPDDVLAQVTWQRYVTGYDHIHVAALIGGNDYRQAVVRRDGEIEAYVLDGATRFWDHHLTPRIEPDWDYSHAQAALELARDVHDAQPGFGDLDVDGVETVMEYVAASARRSAAENDRKAAMAKLARIAAGHAGMKHGGELAFEFAPVRKSSVDLPLLAERFPAAYAACVTEKRHTQIRIADVYRNGDTE